MYPLGSLTSALQNARRKLLDVFEPADSKATREQRTQGMGKGLGSIGRLTQTKSPAEIPRLEAIVTAILEHGTNKRGGTGAPDKKSALMPEAGDTSVFSSELKVVSGVCLEANLAVFRQDGS
jgi:hypothetical protein